MQAILSLLIIVIVSLTTVLPIFAISVSSPSSTSTAPIVYPEWEDFVRLKNLIEISFSPSEKNYRSNCIASGTLCPNYKYTSVIEKAIKFIILKTYTGNEKFYLNLFANENLVSREDLDSLLQKLNDNSSDINPTFNLKSTISRVPRGSSLPDWKTLGFGDSIGGELFDASFGVNFTEGNNSNTMIGAIESKIREMKRDTCQEWSDIDCYSSDLSNTYLPSPDELYAETIYLNRESVQIESLKDEIEYSVKKSIKVQDFTDGSGAVSSRYVAVPTSYTLKYKKDSYTLEEAKIELEKNTQKSEVIKKDYKAMMWGATVPEIPALFAHVPSDSMVLYIRNPANLIDILNQKSNTSQRLSGLDVSESIKGFMKTFFELDDFEQIQKNLKNEMAIVVNNLDATAPDIVIILSESDRDALSPTAQARVVGSKDGYIFVASSKDSLERLTNLPIENSLKEAPDFHYVWWKKSTLVQDAMMFVGDEFFEKMLTLETYITHYRKYRDYGRLSSLQDLVWAYGDAFGRAPSTFVDLANTGLSTLTGELLSEYSIVDGLVTHTNIWTLKSVKTLPEARYDLSKVSRTELEDYKYNVLQYRDIWRSSLDPMGIVMNRYGDGMEIDFFMTPIPSSPDRDLIQIQNIFEWTTKDSLSFVTNSRIRMGLLSFVFGFDPQKLWAKIKDTEDIGRGFEEFSKDVLDGKNIFDYLGGEFAWSIGSLDPDIFQGWNVDKVDAYISVQVASEDKWKELIDILTKKVIGAIGHGGSDTEKSMFSMLAKPLIEDYQWKKIYYVEAIPVPWVWKLGIAYTFVDDFFIIGLNRSTIRHVIDTADSWDKYKKNIVNTESFEKGTFFAMLFDGVNSSSELKNLYKKNQSTIPRFLGDIFRSESTITPFIASYYTTEDRNKRLGKKWTLFNHQIGSLSLSGMSDNLIVKIDPSRLTSLSGTSLEMWESIQKNPTFPSAILTENGVPLDIFLALSNIWDIISLNLITQLDSALGGSESLLRNVTFGMSIWDDEIGFRLRVFRQQAPGQWGFTMGNSSEIWIIGGIASFLILLWGAGFAVYRRRYNSGVESVIPVPVTPTPNLSEQVSSDPLFATAPTPSPILPVTPTIIPTPSLPPEPTPVAPTLTPPPVTPPSPTLPQ